MTRRPNITQIALIQATSNMYELRQRVFYVVDVLLDSFNNWRERNVCVINFILSYVPTKG